MSLVKAVVVSSARSPSVFEHAIQYHNMSFRSLESDDLEEHLVSPAERIAQVRCNSVVSGRESFGDRKATTPAAQSSGLADAEDARSGCCFAVAQPQSQSLKDNQKSDDTGDDAEIDGVFVASHRRYRFIEKGYRPVPSNARCCLMSLFQLHNETVNVWTHVVGAGVFIYLLVALFLDLESPFPSNIDSMDKMVFGTYLTAGSCCMLISSAFHLFSAGFEECFRRLEVADHMGILLLMLGSNVPMIYYGFYGMPVWQSIYMSGTILMVVLAAGILNMQSDRSQQFKLLVFSVVCSYGGCQLLHDIWNRGGIQSLASEAAVLVWVQSFRWYIIGAAFYILKIPERWSPGSFDYFLSSHQIWHVFVILGSLQHINGSVTYMELAKIDV